MSAAALALPAAVEIGHVVIGIAFLLVIAFAFRMLFHALRVEGLLRNLMDAVEAQGRDDKDMERLHAAMEDARRLFRP